MYIRTYSIFCITFDSTCVIVYGEAQMIQFVLLALIISDQQEEHAHMDGQLTV